MVGNEHLGYYICFFAVRKEEGMSVEPTFSVSVIFGKRDEVITLIIL